MTNQSMSEPTGWPDFRLGITSGFTETYSIRQLPPDGSGNALPGRRLVAPKTARAVGRAAASASTRSTNFGYSRPVLDFDGRRFDFPCSKRCATASTTSSGRSGRWSSCSSWGSSTSPARAPSRTTGSSEIIARVGERRDPRRGIRAHLPGAARSNYREQYRGGLTPEMLRFLDLPRQVLDGMIKRKLELEEARRLKLPVGTTKWRARSCPIPAFQQNGQFIGREKYVQLLCRYGYTPERFEEELREDLLAGKYAELVRASILVPDARSQREFSARNDKAIDRVRPDSREPSRERRPADRRGPEGLLREAPRALPQARAAAHQVPARRSGEGAREDDLRPTPSCAPSTTLRRDALKVPEQVVAAHILIKSDATSKGPEADAAAKAKAEKIAARARRRARTSRSSPRKRATTPSNKDTGGQLPPFSRGQMVAGIRAGRVRLSPGEIAGPVKTQFGYHVIKLTSKNPEHVAELRGSARGARRRPRAAQDRSGDEPSRARARREGPQAAERLRRRAAQAPEATIVTFNTTPVGRARRADPGRRRQRAVHAGRRSR